VIFGGGWGRAVRRGFADAGDLSGESFFVVDMPSGAVILRYRLDKRGRRSRSAPSEAAILAAHPGHGNSRWVFAEKDANEWVAAFNEDRS